MSSLTSAALHTARNSGAGSPPGRTMLGQTIGRLMLRQSKHHAEGLACKELAPPSGTGTSAVGSTATGTGPMNRLQKVPSPPHAKKHTLANVGASSLVSKSPTRAKVTTKRHCDHRHLEACYGNVNTPRSGRRRNPGCRAANVGATSTPSQNSSDSQRSAKESSDSTQSQTSSQSSRCRLASSDHPDQVQPGLTHLFLEAALLSDEALIRPSPHKSEGQGCSDDQARLDALGTLPLPSTGSLQSGDFEAPHVSDQWDSASDEMDKCAEQGQGGRSCELLQQELSAINEVSANKNGGDDDESEFTCKVLEAEVCSVSSWVDGAGRHQSHGSSPRSEKSGGLHTPVSEQLHQGLQTDGDSLHASRAEREVQRLSQVLQSYENHVLPHLMVERAMLNCELTTARKAAVTSQEDCQALRGRVLEVEAESSVLRTELDALRAATLGRSRGGG